MTERIIWSPKAEKDLENILDYLFENWGQKITVRFLDNISYLIKQIENTPERYPVINKDLNVRKCVLTKQNTLFYRVINNKIEILRVYDTRQDPKKLKFS